MTKSLTFFNSNLYLGQDTINSNSQNSESSEPVCPNRPSLELLDSQTQEPYTNKQHKVALERKMNYSRTPGFNIGSGLKEAQVLEGIPKRTPRESEKFLDSCLQESDGTFKLPVSLTQDAQKPKLKCMLWKG